MSILIHMEMPKNCGVCFVGDRTICKDHCPLIELQPHGDLIDRDLQLALVAYTGTEGLDDTFDNGVVWTLEYINKLTPVIPAEEE